jgi:hypothetical protein
MEVIAHPEMIKQESMALPEGLQVEVLADEWVEHSTCMHGVTSVMKRYTALWSDSMCRLGAAVLLRSACTPAAVTLWQ